MDYENPIEAVYHVVNQSGIIKFGTKDGVIGVQPVNASQYVKFEFNTQSKDIAKMQVWKDNLIRAIIFFDKDGNQILTVGGISGTMQELILQKNERLIGIKSKLFNNSCSTAYHCNMVFIFGSLE